jgi:dTDP-4-amino-4,6-dideoxygalactose transaminase
MNGLQIRYFGTAKEHKSIYNEIYPEIERVFLGGQSLQGPDVEFFENNLKLFSKRRNCVAVSSCTDALFFSLLAIGIKPGDEVIVPSFSFVASASCILRSGAVPIFCDVDDNGNANAESIKLLVTEKTKAIIYVHMYGYLDELNILKIKNLANNFGLKLIEDAAQAFGANKNSIFAGGLGEISCFSFDPTKVISSFGSGGAVLTDDDELASTVRMLRYHGKTRDGEFSNLGFNSQLPTIAAAVLNVKLKHNNEWLNKRKSIANFYIDQLKELPIGLPPMSNGDEHVYHKFVIKLESRNEMKKYLSSKMIETIIHYDTPLPMRPIFQKFINRASYIRSSELSKKVLSLPCHPFLEDYEIDCIVKSIKSGLEKA